MRRFITYLGLGSLLLLAACSSPAQTTPQGPAISGTITDFMDEFGFVGIALFFADGAALGPTTLIESRPGLFSTEIIALPASGAFTIPLPNADQLHGRLMAGAEEFFSSRGAVICELTASDPSVRVTQLVFESGMVLPGFIAYSALWATPALSSTSPIEDTLEGVELVSWIYAEQDVTVTTEEAGCVDGTSTLHVDLDLTAGWNYIAITFEQDPDDEDVNTTNIYSIESGAIHVLGIGF